MQLNEAQIEEFTSKGFIVVKGICVHLVQRLGHAIGSGI